MIYCLTLLFNYSIVLLFSDEKPVLLSVNPGLIIWTIIIFFLLMLLLKKVAWKPLLNALNTREQTIRDSIEQAEQLKKEAELLIEQNKKNMADANAQSMKIINNAKDMANTMRDDLVAKANDESKKIIDQARIEIKQEKDTAMADLRNEVSDLAIKAAEKILNDNLDENKQKKIVNDFISQIPKN